MKNKYYVCDNEVFIKLDNNRWTIINLISLDLVDSFNVSWYTKKVKGNNYYVVAEVKHKGKRIYWHMHRVILNLPNSSIKEPDHKNRHTLDNRINNLRIVTRSINNINHGLLINNSSGITGVFWNARIKRWWAYIELNGKRISLGHHRKKEDAIEARLKAEDSHV